MLLLHDFASPSEQHFAASDSLGVFSCCNQTTNEGLEGLTQKQKQKLQSN
jgi:hypothetical protein